MPKPWIDHDDWDDGGTPAYRARLAEANASPLKKWYRKASPLDVFLLACGLPLILALLAYPVGLTLIFLASKL